MKTDIYRRKKNFHEIVKKEFNMVIELKLCMSLNLCP